MVIATLHQTDASLHISKNLQGTSNNITIFLNGWLAARPFPPDDHAILDLVLA